MRPVLDDVLAFLVCPHCGRSLARAAASLRCQAGHAFDVARQGYVSLLPPDKGASSGDTAAMVQARASFLAAGHFDHLAAELAQEASRAAGAAGAGRTGDDTGSGAAVGGGICVADVGAGPGYYLAAVLDQLPGSVGLALDTSKFALRRAARAHQRIGAVACDVWRALPVADQSASVVLNVFAPRNGAEFRRILAPGGRLLVITPTQLHLRELIAAAGLLTVDPQKERRLSRTLDPYLVRAFRRDISRVVPLSRADIRAAIMMGPSAWQADPEAMDSHIEGLPDPLPVTLSVTMSCYLRSDR
jgi:23S rRNA (guanine745-N1)-methyltransferase